MSSRDIATRKSSLSAEQTALLEKRLRGKATRASEIKTARDRLKEGAVPLSYFQERLWFFPGVEPSSPIWNAPAAIRLEGQLNIAALEQALTEIVRRHDALRTVFEIRDGKPLQGTVPAEPIRIQVFELEERNELEREAKMAFLAGDEARQPFDLSVSPLMRARLFRFSPEDHVLLIIFHHITFDGWSKGVFFRELITLYGAYATKQPFSLPELPIQYADFAVWHREWMKGAVPTRQLAYWKARLAEAPILNLPADHPHRAVRTFDGERLWISFPGDLSEAVNRLAETRGVTLFMMLLSAFSLLMGRYSGQEDVVIGTHVAGRGWAEVEGLIGFFINQLALRTDLSGDPAFNELLVRVQETTLTAFENQEVPFEKVVEELGVKPDPSRSPVFQIMFTLHNPPWTPVKIAGLTPSFVKFDDWLVRYDIEVDLWKGLHGLEGMFVYNTNLFEQSTATRMVEEFKALLRSIVANPTGRLSELSFASR